MVCQKSARGVLVGLSALVCCLALGCGGEKGHRYSGKVTFKGQPIASGKIYFIPDTSKGNSGPTGFADIKDGQYDTAATGGAGCIGGPMLVKIEAIDPATKVEKGGETLAKALFPTFQIPVDLPKEATTKDFDVPVEALKGGTKPGEIIP